jgi:hypothetical protein
MRHFFQSWNRFKDEVSIHHTMITPIELCERLIEWSTVLREAKDKHVKALSSGYLDYYTKLNLKLYDFDERWYSLENLIETQILKNTPRKIDHLIVDIRDLLNEIIVFKSNRECKQFYDQYLKVFTDKEYAKLYFCCDACSFAEDFDGVPLNIENILIPATAQQVRNHNLSPGLL